jgi:hypothetical protein
VYRVIMSCELKEESEFSKKFDVPFFTMYQLYTDYSGEKWMNVKYAEIGGTKIHYIKQNTPPKNTIINDYGKLNSSFDTIFMPHYWNKTGLVPGNKKGDLQVYIENGGSFVNLSNEETINQTDETMKNYNNTKSYIVHDDLLLSDSHKIPELLMDKILSHARLFLSFKWNDDDDIFYGIYDFADSKWKIESDAYNHEMLTDVKSMNEDENKICEAMTDFLNFVKNGAQPSIVSSAAGGGSGQFQLSSSSGGETNPDYNYDNKGDRKNYQYKRDPTVTKTQPIEKTRDEYNALASSLIKNQTNLNKKTQNFCECYITLINQFINFVISTTKPHVDTSNSIVNLFNYIIANLQIEIEKKKIIFGGGKVTYDTPPKNNNPVTYFGNAESEKNVNKKNVIIVGAGPTGTYMGIILKLMAPDLEVYILEKRIKIGTNEREMTRGENTINVKTTIDVASLTNFNDLIEKYDIDDSKFISTTKKDNFNLIPIDIVFDYKKPNSNALSINKLEYALANYAQTIGVLLFHTNDSYEKHVNSETIGIFDATGGRLKEQKHYYFRVQKEQIAGDGLNINSLDFHNNKIPIICVGESLFKGNYQTGLGMNTICTMCFFVSFLFTLTMGVKEGYAETYKKFFEKDFPIESEANITGPDPGPDPISTSIANPGPTSSLTSIANPVSTSSLTSITNPVSTPISTSIANPVSTPISTSIANPVSTSSLTSITNPVSTSSLTSITNPVSTSVSTSVPKNKTFIGVIFKDMIPEEVNVVHSIPTGSTVEKIDEYIDNIVNGSAIPQNDKMVYFELTAEDEIEMADLIGKI